MDRTGQVSNAYGVMSTPTTLLVAPNGTVAATRAGVVTQDWLEGNIEDHIGR